MSVQVSGGGSAHRRVVISCDAPGCPNRAEPVAAEAWRSDSDATTWARSQARGWVPGPGGTSDFCPEHVALAHGPAAVAPAGRAAAGDKVHRDSYADALRAELIEADGPPVTLAAGPASVVARLLDELAGAHRGDDLGELAGEMAALLRSRP